MPTKKPSIDTFRKIANACGGILSDMAANLGVERSTIYTWCKDDERFAQALEDSRERFVDLAESNLRKLVAGVPAIETDENGDKRFVIFINNYRLLLEFTFFMSGCKIHINPVNNHKSA